ncbi:alpha/beta hydrolase [Mycolicibacterium chubuense]|uniref:Alpha/beta hydrolase family protein n=1 Tax=Mycolicibacterium chubuense TaxID=1800 RepID=A0A0J6VUP5_MYCCU|nr:alpha/beta fold hydrolase [Mycolicibacterium chubuense]KMO73208.1 Alpha/beta hydrolase family protein [Mycolicibacterium chubuense]ORA56779.1 alpha/beta hydrolase [Mycolicibacterium chubuense]SPX98744.1 Phospholipase/Carboxylesterase [Mycolicibacterium chubuense]
MDTVEYAPHRHADVYGAPSDPSLLLWHGTQTDARATVRRLAEALEQRGFGVVAPDWDSHAPDGGRAGLLASVEHVRGWSTEPDRLTLVGWSLGGAAAAGLTLAAQRFGVALGHTVCLAGAFMVADPISGSPLTDLLAGARPGAPFTLLHGRTDDVVPLAVSRSFATELEEVGWPVRVVELDTDHGAIAGARYDAAADRYAPSEDPTAIRVATEVADLIVAARQ